MAPAYDHGPLTLPVRSLSSSTPFYLATLQPLGYRFVSEVHHKTSTASSTAVGLGPSQSSRVDLFLSQSDNNPGPVGGGNPTQVVFPAATRVAVREAYAAALNAGGRTIAPPSDQADGLFNAVVADTDGNRVEIAHEPTTDDHNNDPTLGQRGGSTAKWTDGVAGSILQPKPASNSVQPSPSKATSVLSARSDQNKAESRPTPDSSLAKGNAVVGTLIGAAAGAALTYAVIKSKDDSSRAEEQYKTGVNAKNRIKSEARAQRDRDIALIDNDPQQQRTCSSRRESLPEQDSGYYSSDSPQDTYPKMIRSGTWPESTSTRSRTTRKLIEYATPPTSRRPEASKQRSEVSTKYTVTPPKPPLPYSMERQSSQSRNVARSHVTTASRSSTNEKSRAPSGSSRRHSQSGSVATKKETSPDNARAASKYDAGPSRGPSKAPSRHYSVVQSRAPSKPVMTPSSRAPNKYSPSRTSNSTNHTARRVPLPPSGAPTMVSARDVPLPPSEIDASILDDLETVVPDDSISCAPSPPRSPKPKRSHVGSKYSGKTGYSGHRHARPGLAYG